MDTSPDHAPGSSDEHDHREEESLLERAVTAVTGTPKGDRTEPGAARGWEQPLEEQQAEPEPQPPAQ